MRISRAGRRCRQMAGLAILKHTYDLSDEVLCERWVENPITSSSAARSSSSTAWCSTAPSYRQILVTAGAGQAAAVLG